MKKFLAIALLAILAVSSLSCAVAIANAKEKSNRGWGWGSWKKNGNIIPFQRSWVRLNGIAETWTLPEGSQKVNGSLSINARTLGTEEDNRETAFATAIWSNTTNFRQNGNFSYSFYIARLVEVGVSSLDVEGADFLISGKWNVVNVTTTQAIIKTGDSESGYTVDRQTKTKTIPIVTKAEGELAVVDNKFVLSIEGTHDLNGVVTRTRMTQMDFNKFKLSEDDTEKVSRDDLKVLAKNLRARPGWGSYDSNMDFNGNYKIDIADLATVAANVQET